MTIDRIYGTTSGAVISWCQRYRYALWRSWRSMLDDVNHVALFVMLNPSTADGEKDDATIRRCVGFAKALDCNALLVVNLFALRSTDPAALYYDGDAIGPDNDRYIDNALTIAKYVICAWGKHGALRGRGDEVLRAIGPRATALKLNKDGTPAHPLYLSADARPVPLIARHSCGEAGRR